MGSIKMIKCDRSHFLHGWLLQEFQSVLLVTPPSSEPKTFQRYCNLSFLFCELNRFAKSL